MRDRWIKYDSLSSTNTYISDLLKQKDLEEGLVVIADYQDAGRGMGSHSWVSKRGENLLMSMLLFPAFLSAQWQFHLSRVVSLALCDVLESLGLKAVIKWPNDILCSLGKIAGILIEHGITAGKISHTIAGIGLNLNQTDFPSFELPASSLLLETGKAADVDEVGEFVEARLLSRYQDLKEGLTDKLEQDYLGCLYKAGVLAEFKSEAGLFEGIIRGVNEFGELMVEHKGAIRSFGHGSINMVLEFDRS
jgi:BirA family biotin operon repressor/biotin-[acetyl-CoA-carboxylase] ligase